MIDLQKDKIRKEIRQYNTVMLKHTKSIRDEHRQRAGLQKGSIKEMITGILKMLLKEEYEFAS